MNKKLFGFMAAGMALLFSAQAFALTVGTSGSGSISVGASASSSSGTSISASSGMNMDMNMGSSSSGTLGLQMQVQAGAVNASSGDIVSLQGNTLNMIQSSDDLAAYNNLVVQARPSISSVNVASDNTLTIAYKQPARFLGLFPATLSGTVVIDGKGNTTVHLPWYAFLYAKDTTSVQDNVAAAVQGSGATFDSNSGVNVSSPIQNQARIINAATAAIQSEVDASSSVSANVTTTGNVSTTGY